MVFYLLEVIFILTLGIIFLEPKDFLFLIKKIHAFRESIFSFADSFSFFDEQDKTVKSPIKNSYLHNSHPYKIVRSSRYVYTPLLLINKL